MNITHAFSVVFLTGGLLALSGLPAHAQTSSGGTPAGVTEGLQGQTGSSKTQGVPGSGWNPNDKEKAEPVTLDALKKDVEQTHGGASAVAAEKLKEDSMQGARTEKTQKQSGTSATGSDRPKKDPQAFQQLNSDKTVQGQDLVNEQPMDKQQPANRSASERGARHK